MTNGTIMVNKAEYRELQARLRAAEQKNDGLILAMRSASSDLAALYEKHFVPMQEYRVKLSVIQEHKLSGLSDEKLLKLLDTPVKLFIDQEDERNDAITKRVQNVLRYADIITVRDLVGKSASWMLKTPNFGRTCLARLEALLGRYGLYFDYPLANIGE